MKKCLTGGYLPSFTLRPAGRAVFVGREDPLDGCGVGEREIGHVEPHAAQIGGEEEAEPQVEPNETAGGPEIVRLVFIPLGEGKAVMRWGLV